MIDSYTKAVLSVIAAALIVLAVENLLQEAKAQTTACGTYQNPCLVTTDASQYPLAVRIKSN
jgi:hypothetical protein